MALVFSLGSNSSGQLGIGHSEDVSVPKNILWAGDPAPASVVKVAAGGNHTLLLDSNGDLYWSGNPTSGACGDLSARGRPSQPVFTRVTLGRDGELAGSHGPVRLVAATWEASIFTTADIQGKNVHVYTCGLGLKGELGQGPLIVRDPQATALCDFPPAGTEVVDLAAGMSHVVAVLDNGDVYGWGNGRKGQIGIPNAVVFVPRKIADVGFHVVRAVCGKDFTCLFGNSRDGQVAVIGQDKWGIKSGAPATLPGWLDIGAGWGNVFILKDDGRILAWGRNDYFQTMTPDDNMCKATQIAVGSEHALALMETAEVVAWGWGEHGNCGPPIKQADNESKGRRNTIASSRYLPPGFRITGVGAGCATSWVMVEQS